MHTVSDILESLGGYAVVAEKAGIPATTVHSWQRKNFVPEWRRPALLAIAKRKRVALSEADFPPPPKAQQDKAA
jgi:hypothetical protein